MSASIILSTWSFGMRGNEAAWPRLAAGGSSIDAVEKVCAVVEADHEVDSVGFGGLPDASGSVSLDGCIMLAPDRCGSACCVRRFMHPVSIARRVMELTPHVMLAGDGADAFADAQGFMPADLLAANAQDAWNKWRKDRAGIDQSKDKSYFPPRPIDRGTISTPSPAALGGPGEGGGGGTGEGARTHTDGGGRGSGRLYFHPAPPPDEQKAGDENPTGEDEWKHHDTIGVLALDTRGVLAGACSTSGTPFKLPGRVGDSPIIGHGLYVDPNAGAAVATGAGELIMGVCGSFLAVELMRRGVPPLEALRETLQRIIDAYELRPEHQVAMIALRPDGQFASASLRPGYKTSVREARRSEAIEPDVIVLNVS